MGRKVNIKNRRVEALRASAGTVYADSESTASTANTKEGTGADTTAGTGADTTAGERKPAEKSNKIPVLKEPKKVPIEPQEQEPEPEEKPRKKRVTKKQKTDANVENISGLLVSVSGVIASRPNMSYWKISEAEAQTIAEPLQKVLENYSMSEKLGKYADHIALATACCTVFAPRIVMSVSMEKERRKKEKEAKEIERKIAGNTGKDSGNGGTAGNDKTVSKYDDIQPALVY